MLMFWVDESGEVTADEDAAMMIAVKSRVEEMRDRGVLVGGGPLRSAREAKIVRVSDGELLVSDGPFAETKEQIGWQGWSGEMHGISAFLRHGDRVFRTYSSTRAAPTWSTGPTTGST